jgi:uncharacterized repeat protein (TIGR03803 family)
MTKLSSLKMASAIFVLCAATAVAAPAQVFKTLADFEGANGANPYFMSLVQGRDGGLYGTTALGGTVHQGTVVKIGTNGALRTLYSFCIQIDCSDGSQPYAGLVLAADGNFYGTTALGGDISCGTPSGCGTVFKMTPEGTLATLHTFEGAPVDGAFPIGNLIQGEDGSLYGTTFHGGANDQGTVFKISTSGTLTLLHSFDGSDGLQPYAGLVQNTDGDFYGTTELGGTATDCLDSCGTIFRITRQGKLTTLYTFCMLAACADGSAPLGGVALDNEDDLYGTTASGGTGSQFCPFVGGCGTLFRITSGGTLTTLYSFCSQPNCADGSDPVAGLVRATDGNFYGTTQVGGSSDCNLGCGTAFFINSVVLVTLHRFVETDGADPEGALVQATNGTFYGVSEEGGTSDLGTLFSLSTGLGPFVTFVRAAGKVGQTGGILGQGFTGTTSVSLNGTPATFTVLSDTFIKATVPAGATTGFVTVTTPTGTLTSDVPFHVIP